jgi:hypothetical protein
MKEFIMSDFSSLGSFSQLDDLGPTETTWQPYAFRASRNVAESVAPPSVREVVLADELA